jgi:hypothetical protein
MTTEKLTLAEAYYMVAADLQRRLRWLTDTAENLNRIADRLTEDAMLEKEQEEKP